VRDAATLVWFAWVTAVEGTALSPREQQVYLRGLTSKESIVYPYKGDPYAALVQNTAPQAAQYEAGFEAYHLPERIDWARARTVRVTKQGVHYLVVPFQHGAYRGVAPQTQHRLRQMPSSVYRVARYLQPGQRLTAGSSSGQALHAPGMEPYVPAFARNRRPEYDHVARQEGMVRRPGAGRGSTYLTFRTLREDSPGWWIPGRPGIHLVEAVTRDVQDRVSALVADGIRADIRVQLQERTGGAR